MAALKPGRSGKSAPDLAKVSYAIFGGTVGVAMLAGAIGDYRAN
jgi:hypothetical protein